MIERDCENCKNYKWVEAEIHGGRQIGGFYSCSKWNCNFEAKTEKETEDDKK